MQFKLKCLCISAAFDSGACDLEFNIPLPSILPRTTQQTNIMRDNGSHEWITDLLAVFETSVSVVLKSFRAA
jgi:hypothetical protein